MMTYVFAVIININGKVRCTFTAQMPHNKYFQIRLKY